MKYEQKSFSVPFVGKDYSDNWERIFGRKRAEDAGAIINDLPNVRVQAVVEADEDESGE